jgi:hypothetical protein
MPRIVTRQKKQLKWSVYPETIERIRKIAEKSFREPGQVIDYLVEQAWSEEPKTEEPKNG